MGSAFYTGNGEGRLVTTVGLITESSVQVASHAQHAACIFFPEACMCAITVPHSRHDMACVGGTGEEVSNVKRTACRMLPGFPQLRRMEKDGVRDDCYGAVGERPSPPKPGDQKRRKKRGVFRKYGLGMVGRGRLEWTHVICLLWEWWEEEGGTDDRGRWFLSLTSLI